MDKLVSLGSRKRPLYNEASPNEVFPVDDEAWELGDISESIQGTVSSPYTEQQSTFGRLCQGALLASRMLDHSKRLETIRLNCERFSYPEVVSLTEAAHELSTSIQAEIAARPTAYFSLIPAQCLAYSAVMKVLSIYTAEAPDDSIGVPSMEGRAWTGDDVSLQMTCIESRKAMSEQIHDFAKDLLSFISCDGQMVKTSPFVLDAVYSAATVFLAAWKDGGDQSAEESFATTKKLLVRLSGRWRLGAEYLKALDHHEMNAMIGQNFASSQAVPILPSSSMVTIPTIVC